MWVRPARSGREDTLRGDLRFGNPFLERTNVWQSQQFAPLWFCTFPTEFVKRMRHMCFVGDPEAEKLLKQPKGTHRRSLGNIGPVWSLLVEENKAPAEAKSFNCVGRSSSYCCSDRIISNTRSIACANSSWHDSTSAHRLHIHNHTFTTTHFPPSLSNTLGLLRDVLSCREEMISQHWIPRRSN